MSVLHSQLTRSADEMEACDKIIPWPALSEIGTKIAEAHHAYQDAFRAHGTDAQELRKQLRLMCKAGRELTDMIEGLEEGLGR